MAMADGFRAEDGAGRRLAWFLALALGVCLVKGLLNVAFAAPENWFLMDAAFRVVLIAALLWHADARRVIHAPPEPRIGMAALLIPVAVILILVPLDPILFAVLGPALEASLSGYEAFKYPGYPAAWVRYFDLTVGLFLVALSEELLFRKLARHYLEAYFQRRWLVVLLSAPLFGLFHWSAGLDNIILTTLLGACFMAGYYVARVLWPMVVMHFLANFYSFADVPGLWRAYWG